MPPAMPLHEHLRRHARAQPDKACFVWYGTSISYGELDRASDAFAAALHELGVRKGEPVALFMGNCPQYAMAHFGIQKLGAIVCPCGPLNKEHELAYQLDDLKARVLIAADVLLPIVARVRDTTSLEHVFAVRYAQLLPDEPTTRVPDDLIAMRETPMLWDDGIRDFLAATRSGARGPEVAIDMDDIALMTYTSGTTGLPKGAMLSYDNATYKATAAAESGGLFADDVLLAIAPLYHIAGMLMGLNVTVLAGVTTALMHRFDPLATLQTISKYHVTWWYSIAPMNVAVMQVPGAADFDLTSLSRNPVTSFGITYTEAIHESWRGFAPRVLSFEAAYGLSETHTMDTFMPADAVRWGTHGRPVPGTRIRIVDADGNECAPGAVGEITLRGRGNFHGYWNRPEATASTLRDGWVHTGDIGQVDADGYLTFMGRFKEMIKVSGYSVFPEEVETLLVRHPAVAQAAVIGVADAAKGEVVRAFVVRRPGEAVDEEALMAWSRENMAAYKAPRSVRFIDALPATGAGKVLRRMLRDLD